MIVSFLLLSSGQWLVGSLCPLWEHAGQSELFEILRVTKNCGYYAGPVAQPSLGAQWRTGGGRESARNIPAGDQRIRDMWALCNISGHLRGSHKDQCHSECLKQGSQSWLICCQQGRVALF